MNHENVMKALCQSWQGNLKQAPLYHCERILNDFLDQTFGSITSLSKKLAGWTGPSKKHYEELRWIAWEEIIQETIAHCWIKADIPPPLSLQRSVQSMTEL